MTTENKTTIKHSRNGFTLIELAMVVLIFGMVSTVLMMALQHYYKVAVVTETKESLEMGEAALFEYQINFGYYPCPADPSLGPGDPDYGYEGKPCNPGSTYEQNVEGGRDTLADADATPDRVLIGSIPFNTLTQGRDRDPRTEDDQISYIELTDKLSVDGWGNKLTYAVTASQTNPGTYNDFNGAIDVVDENNLDVMPSHATAHYVLISHGEDGLGAYKADGQLVAPCPATFPVPAPAVPPVVPAGANEIDNCNDADGKFVDGLKMDADHSFNDDYTNVVINQSGDLWEYVGDNKISNTNSGFVGIGTDLPAERLHVAGTISSNTFWADKYCDATGDDTTCLSGRLLDPAVDQDPATAGTQNMRCPVGQVVTEIRNNRVVCSSGFSGFSGPLTCPSGRYLVGISNVRGALCCDPLLPSGNPNSCLSFTP